LNQPSLKAVLFRGRGRHFSAGADLASLEGLAREPQQFQEALTRGKELLQLIDLSPVPTLAMINGSCLGAGLELALRCHFRFSSPNAMFGFPEAELGLMPGFGGTLVDDRLRRAKRIELCLSGRLIGADEALEIGLIDRIAAKKELARAAEDFLSGLVQERSSKQIRAILTSINNGRLLSQDEALRRESALFCSLVRERGEGGGDD
ncbi:MAG: enoyl-CoA hydratase/isomerase family protein, partial [Thermodesulfobacteriota bacterium]